MSSIKKGHPLYLKACDYHVNNDGTLEEIKGFCAAVDTTEIEKTRLHTDTWKICWY